MHMLETSRDGYPKFIQEIIDDAPIYFLMISFGVIAQSVNNYIGRACDFCNIVSFMIAGGLKTLAMGALALAIIVTVALYENRATYPENANELLSQARIARYPSTVLIFLMMPTFISAFTSLKVLLPHTSFLWADEAIAEYDRSINGGHDAWELLRDLYESRIAVIAIEWLYNIGWPIVTTGIVTLAMSFTCRPRRLQYFVTFFLTWIIQGLVIPVILFAGGPVFFGAFTGDFERFSKIYFFLQKYEATYYSSADVQSYLLNIYAGGVPGFGAGISAFPSVHVGLAYLCVLASLGSGSALLRVSAIIFFVMIMIGSVLLGWHYAVDGYVAIILTQITWSITGRLLSERSQPAKMKPDLFCRG